jgi:ergothioneine biosynthesis protein EgtB
MIDQEIPKITVRDFKAQPLPVYQKVRSHTEDLCRNLKPEDTVVQPMEDVSPAKWHLGHTSWFFENFILKPYYNKYKEFHPEYAYIFNSYYTSQGDRVERDSRGWQTRPSFNDILKYRAHVDDSMEDYLSQEEASDEVLMKLEVGLHHEQQHQELLITDTKYILYQNVLNSPMLDEALIKNYRGEEGWIHIEEGIQEIGFSEQGFCFDSEMPRHKVYQVASRVSRKPVLAKEYLAFIEDGGYEDVLLWLSDGWAWKQENKIDHPLYWKKTDDGWLQFTTAGWQSLMLEAPVAHVSFYEADAYARWSGHRLCTEAERELVDSEITDNQCWEWTGSAYRPYPGFEKWEGGLGEYNGKFMVNQMVLRGGSVATSEGHYRPSYRNFFHTDKRWQFTGIRLAKDLNQ